MKNQKSEILDLICNKYPNLPWLKTNIIYLVEHGSVAYGTNIEGSDIDYKSFCFPPKEYYFSFHQKFEQVQLSAPEPDLVVYEIRKFFKLLAECNPSIIEVLFVDPSNIVINTKLGEKILEHRQEFLSKKCRWTFGGYASSQIKRINLHRGYLLNPPTKEPTRKDFGLPEFTLIPQDQLAAAYAEIEKVLQKYNLDFLDDLDESKKIGIHDTFHEILAEMKIYSDEKWNAAARKIGCDENFIYLMSKEREYNARRREWDQYLNWKKNRNHVRAEMEAKFGFDGKHGLHLIRLLLTCKEMLDTGTVQVKRHDAEELKSIRNGAWSYEKLVEESNKLLVQIDESYKKSKLPNAPNINKLDQLCMEIIEEGLGFK